MLRYDGMYVYFPENNGDFYYFIRLFEEGKASGRMIQSNYTFQEIYRMVYGELENQRNFDIIQFGKSIMLESNLIFDLKGTVEENGLKLLGTMKDGRPWRGGRSEHYIFIPKNMVMDPNRILTISKIRSPLSMNVDGRILEYLPYDQSQIEKWKQASADYQFMILEENEHYHLSIEQEQIVVENNCMIGFYLENHLFDLEETGVSKISDGKIITLEKL